MRQKTDSGRILGLTRRPSQLWLLHVEWTGVWVSRALVVTGKDWCLQGPKPAERAEPQGLPKGAVAPARAGTVFVLLEVIWPGDVLWVRGQPRAAWGTASVLNTALL